MKVFILPNPGKADAYPILRQAGRILTEAGGEVLLAEQAAPYAEDLRATVLPEEACYRDCDVILTIGGDGTMLHAARRALETQKPLLGVNIGRLGFLTIVESDELEKLRRLPAGDFMLEPRTLLCARPQNGPESFALNDVVLFKESAERSISLNIYCDNILVSRFRGDGIICATPTGSTAYSLSAGGPILDAALGGMVVTQICAHIVQTPPLVFSATRVLKAVPAGIAEERVIVSCDGTRGRTLDPGQEVYITQADKTVQMVQFSVAEQLESIDKKLKGR